jgi:hypothetical protein
MRRFADEPDDDFDTAVDEELHPDCHKPVPGLVMEAICLMPRGLEGDAWATAAKSAIRKALTPLPADWQEPGLFQMYSARLWPMIREVLAEN